MPDGCSIENKQQESIAIEIVNEDATYLCDKQREKLPGKQQGFSHGYNYNMTNLSY